MVVEHERVVEVGGGWEVEECLERAVHVGGGQQVIATGDVGDLLVGVVHDHGEVV